MKPNNLDHALVPAPERDPWADDVEPTEDTGRAGQLTWGPMTGEHFAAAHRIGEDLRRARRRRATGKNFPVDQGAKRAPPRIGYCGECGKYVTPDGTGWHAGCTNGRATEVVTDEPASVTDYYADLQNATDRLKGKRKDDIPADIRPEWREVPGYPNYALHSVTRALRNQKTGRVLTPHNSSYSLSVNGVRSSYGVNVLWKKTFPEYASGKKKKLGEWDDTVTYHDPEKLEWDGVAEWLGEGGAHTTTK